MSVLNDLVWKSKGEVGQVPASCSSSTAIGLEQFSLREDASVRSEGFLEFLCMHTLIGRTSVGWVQFLPGFVEPWTKLAPKYIHKQLTKELKVNTTA